MENKIQFLSVFLMSFLGIYVFVGINSEVTGLKGCEERYYQECALGDEWVRGRDFTTQDLADIRTVNGVENAVRRLETKGKARLKSEELGDDPDLTLFFIEDNEISKIKICEGNNYSPGCMGVWLDRMFAEKRGLEPGDKITIKLENKEFTEKIEGLFYHPEFVYYVENMAAMMPAYGRYGVAVLDISEYPLEDPGFNTVVIDAGGIDNLGDMTDEEKILARRIGTRIKKTLDDDQLVVMDKSELLSYSTFSSELQQHRSMSFAFPIVFVLISLLGIITTMSRLLSRQRVQIGTLKALGFSTRRIMIHYMSYGFVLSLAGSILGAAAGYRSLPAYIIGMFTETYILPYMQSGFSALSFIMIVLEVAVTTLITLYACRRECSLIPAAALRPASPKVSAGSFLEKTPLWDKLDFSVRWNLRDIMRNKLRSMMGAAGAAGCAMLMFSALGCMDSLTFITGWMYGEINTAETKILMEEDTPYGVTRDYAKKYAGQMIQNASIVLTSDSAVKTGTLTVLDSGNLMHFQDEDRRHIVLSKNETGLSYRMAQMLEVKEGDFITWNIQGEDEKHRVRVGQIYRNPSAQGITMFRETFEAMDCNFRPTEILTNMSVDPGLKDKEEITDVQSMDEMMSSMDAMMDMMYSMAAILITAAVVLAVVVLYNLGVLSLLEKRREMATLKVLGLSTETIRGILQQQNIWVTLVGTLFGYIAGFGILGVMFSDMPEGMDYCIVVYPLSYVLTFIGTLMLSVIVNRVLSADVKNIEMATALKGQE